MILRAHKELQVVMQQALGVLEQGDEVRMGVERRVELQASQE